MYAYFAGGCFWCITPIFEEIPGVISVTCGYCGGDEVNPTYEDVKSQSTGHRETIRVEYDENKVDYDDLLRIFFDNVDLTDDGGQFIDRGFSYTLAVYYVNDEQKEKVQKKIASYKEKIFVVVEKYKEFYVAEEYHQDYYLKNPEAFEKELVESGRKGK